MHAQNFRLHSKWRLTATSRKKIVEMSAQEELNDNAVVAKKKTSRTSKRATTKQTGKKSETDALEENSDLEINSDASDEESVLPTSSKDIKKPRKTRRKGKLLVM